MKKKEGVLASKYKEMETSFLNWVVKQPLPVATAIATLIDGVKGGILSMIFDMTVIGIGSAFPQIPSAFKISPGRTLIRARHIAVLTGSGAGISYVLGKVGARDDLQTRMVAWFGAGMLHSMARRHPPEIQIFSGFVFAYLFKITKGHMFSESNQVNK